MLVLVVFLRRNVVARNTVLLIASYYFYGVWDWRFLGLLIISTVIDYGVGRFLGELPTGNLATHQRLRNRKRVLIVSLAANLLFLGFFKYFGFFVDNAARLIEAIGFEASIPVLHIVLPVGLSFYTFQSMAYTTLVYRGELPPERSLLNFAVYVAFFPQLVAGPIERPTNILPQVQNKTSVRREDLYYGFYLICCGLFKKVVVAENAAQVADMVFGADNPA